MRQLFEYLISKANKKNILFSKNKVQKGFMFENGDIIAITGKKDLYVFIERELVPDNIWDLMDKDGYGIFIRTNKDNISDFDEWFMVSPDTYDEKLVHYRYDDLSIKKLWRAGIDPFEYSSNKSLSNFCKNWNLIFEKD